MPRRFNHMELTFPRGALDEATRADIRQFYGDVFGWRSAETELFGQTNLILLGDDAAQQFILLAEADRHIDSPGYDHLGLLCDTRDEVDELLETCRRYQEKDDRVRLKTYEDLVTPPVTTKAFYVKYLLPIWFDVQCITYDPGSEPGAVWSYGPA
jgi:hypothetical protein